MVYSSSSHLVRERARVYVRVSPRRYNYVTLCHNVTTQIVNMCADEGWLLPYTLQKTAAEFKRRQGDLKHDTIGAER